MDIRIENGFDQSQDLKEFPSIYPKYGMRNSSITLNHDSACNTSLGFRAKRTSKMRNSTIDYSILVDDSNELNKSQLSPFPSTQAVFKNAKPS